MTKDLKLWLEFIESDDKVAKKLLEKKLKYSDNQKGFEEFLKKDFIPMAQEYGYDVSEKDATSYTKSTMKALSESELEFVAGGGLKKNELIGIGLASVMILFSLSVISIFLKQRVYS